MGLIIRPIKIMGRTAMNIVLNSDLENLIKEKVQSGRYGSAEEVIQDALNLLKQRDRAVDRVEALLQEAEDSGEATEMTDRDWEEIRREGLARLRARKSSKP